MVICKFVDCKTRAGFGMTKIEFCFGHKTSEMVDLVSKKCKFVGCKTRASFGISNSEYCCNHKTSEMTNISSKKCKSIGCDKQPSFGIFEARYCYNHKTSEMTNTTSKKCKYIGCNKQPVFGIFEAGYCSKHKTSEMADMSHKKCKFIDCKTRPSFGINIVDFCSKHKTSEMSDLVNKKCKFIGCNKQRRFGLPGKTTEYCSKHKTPEMSDLVSKKCTSCNLFYVSSRDNYLCSYCRPNSRQITKELVVKKLLEDNNINFTHNKEIKNDCCLKYRPDFSIDCGKYFVILECDENAHKSYDRDCELVRMNNISHGLGLPTLFIRYNPDLKNVKTIDKHNKLLEVLNVCIKLDELVDPTPIYLFY